MIQVATIWATTRSRFLLLTPLCVLLGAAAVVSSGYPISPGWLVLVLLGALSAHIAVNTLNEYEDFRSGLDMQTRRTPFSGGSGALPSDPASAPGVLIAVVISLGTTVLLGSLFVYRHGAEVLVLGLLGVLLILTYTRWINRFAGLCLIAPGLGFGPLMVLGTAVVLGAGFSEAAMWLSLLPFFLVNNLLLANQLPDREPDEKVGRNHVAIRYGTDAAVRVYVVFLALAYTSIIVPVALDVLPVEALVALSTLVLAVPVVRGLRRYANYPDQLERTLGLNVALTLLTIGLLDIAVLIGAR